jgi:hypothetical protein
VLLRISSLKGTTRIAWMLFQLGGVGIYIWLYLVHISKVRGSPMEADAMTGWLRPLYFRPGETALAFLERSTVSLFQFLFSSVVGGEVALALFIGGILWLFGSGIFQKRRDLAAFGVLSISPFAFGMLAALNDLYPYGASRHSMYLIFFAVAGVSASIAAMVRQKLLPILILAILVIPYWDSHPLKDPQEMEPAEQAKALMTNAIAALRTSVPPSETVFSDYQASLLLEYYLDPNHPPPPQRDCGGVSEVQYGAYRVVIVPVWSATGDELTNGIGRWRKACDSAARDSFWIFDAGWGVNLVDALGQSAPSSISQESRFGKTISLFETRMDH